MDNKKQLDGLDIEKVNKIAEHYEAIPLAARRRHLPRRAGENTYARRKSNGIPDFRLPQGRRQNREIRYIQPRRLTDGDCQRHRVPFALRAPHTAFLRKNSNRIHPRRKHRGTKQNRTRGRRLRPTAASAGTHDTTNLRPADTRALRQRRNRILRSNPHVHAHARSGKRMLHNADHRIFRSVRKN